LVCLPELDIVIRQRVTCVDVDQLQIEDHLDPSKILDPILSNELTLDVYIRSQEKSLDTSGF
jgi:hypothetical protein